MDISPDLVHKAERKFRKEIADGRVRVLSAGVSQLPFSDRAFDRVFTINTIYFWPDPVQGMREILRVLRNEGRAVVSLRSKETLQNDAVTKFDFHLYFPEDAAALRRNAGFRNVQIELGLEGTLTNKVLGIGRTMIAIRTCLGGLTESFNARLVGRRCDGIAGACRRLYFSLVQGGKPGS